MATSEAQKAASKRYREKNKERQKVTSYRTTARMFINNHATLAELEELESLIEERRQMLNED